METDLGQQSAQKETLEQLIHGQKVGRVEMELNEIRLFFRGLSKGNINDLAYRIMLVSILVNRIYLYDDRLTLIINADRKPVTVSIDTLNDIELSNIVYFQGSVIGGVLPPRIKPTSFQKRVLFCVECACQMLLRVRCWLGREVSFGEIRASREKNARKGLTSGGFYNKIFVAGLPAISPGERSAALGDCAFLNVERERGSALKITHLHIIQEEKRQ